MARESDLYPGVEKWARTHLGCWETGINTGPRVGRVDVVGVRDVGGDLSGRSEVIAIEVKAGVSAFATSAGQAHGYSVMADRCYLADLREPDVGYSADERLIAGRLGIGLLLIRPNGRIDEVLTPPPAEPLEELRLQLIEKIGLALCSVCSTLFRRSDGAPGDFNRVVRGKPGEVGLAEAAAAEKGYMWWLGEAATERETKTGRKLIYWRRYLCGDCVSYLAPRVP